MLVTKIYSENSEIDLRLRAFDVSRNELVAVAQAVVAARADTTDNDPATAEGQLAYIYGTRATRALWRTKKWLLHRQENIEAVSHPEKPLRVIYQSVDLAASKTYRPRPISGKGSGSDRVISDAQGSLFKEEELAANAEIKLGKIDSGVWYFCVSVSSDDVRAELSLPSGISEGNFEDFIERIFVIREGEWSDLASKYDTGDTSAVSFEPVVTRKM